MLNLGLQRISRLVAATQLPWRAIHVAGTNGKGSVCAYASSILHAAGVSWGRFTSPHLLDRWDCITINGYTVQEDLFRSVEHDIKKKDRQLGLGATEFEILTATAFEIFSRKGIDVGVVEVGVGGRLDATNVLQQPLVTVITRIARDHQALLGDTIEQIAVEKGGIMKPGVPCFVDCENDTSVAEVLRQCAKKHEAGPVRFVGIGSEASQDLWQNLHPEDYAPHQQINIVLAHEATLSVLAQKRLSIDPISAAKSIASTHWPGRLQLIDISKITNRKTNVLLDGAHNTQATRSLAAYVDATLRATAGPLITQSVTWVLAASAGKEAGKMFDQLVRSGDQVITVGFGPVDGMPWVTPIIAKDLSLLLDKQFQHTKLKNVNVKPSASLKSALQEAAGLSKEGPIVVAGSLYLAADLLRLLREQCRT